MSVLLSLLALWAALVLCGLGNTVGYHRLLTHRAFRAGPGVRGLFTLLGAVTGGSPLFWVGLHRFHHLHSDSEDDPHSPHKGFWWAHCGWLLGTEHPVLCAAYAVSGFGQQASILVHDLRRLAGRNPPTWHKLCRDLKEDPLLATLDKPGVMPVFFAMQVGLAWAIGGPWGLLWLWGLHAFVTNSSWAVNSLCHLPSLGHQPHDTGDDSRDVPWLALLTNGESYHNGHHRYPRSARHGLEGGLDLSWWTIAALARIGLATDVWLPRAYRKTQ